MKIQVISDVHAEFHDDGGKQFWEDFPVVGDVLVIAGDLGTKSFLTDNLCWAAEKFPHVVYVPGNHEYWHAKGYNVVADCIRAAIELHPNIHWLLDNDVVINSIRFLGATMWFKSTPSTQWHEREWSDFRNIPQARRWLYDANSRTQRYLSREVQPGDVVVTHHLPCDLSVNSRFRSGPNAWQNDFYVCDMTDVILDKKPAVWVHGHTHDHVDYQLGETRVVANPFGYVGHEPVAKTDLSVCIEVESPVVLDNTDIVPAIYPGMEFELPATKEPNATNK